ncbi:unnamed protein product [Darwinula stevensoni]|uniref:ABC transporter domain-containing protein n=1 Tax=Darwinula stevensoni TaxID=69355 RepID=A0A7R9ACB6_9CRUS|nr:unnamed protein product [Darwinula stevensoni]CAG0900205.1 unnamed protein product [Darwinula stevensoni]
MECTNGEGPLGISPSEPTNPVWVKRKKPMRGFSHLAPRNPLEITYFDVHYWVPDGRRGMKEILKGLDGRMKPGELTAIMGPSGAGKSSLMNILAGYRQNGVTGKVEMNGRERDLRVFRHLSTYIPQQDHVIPNLTVMESMRVAANLKLPSSMPSKDKLTTVVEILEHLGIQNCAETRAGCLSGGQKKRLCIALELVNNPPVLFFDEPTSGLDSSSCLQCVSLLKMLASEGRTVICTIHQPSARILEIFDHLILLSEGMCLYNDTIASLVPYLKLFNLHCPSYHNPADFVMEVAVGDHGREAMKALCDAVKLNATKPPELEIPDPETPLDANGQSSTPLSGLWGRIENSMRKKLTKETKPEFIDDLKAEYAVSFAKQVQCLYLRFLKTTTRDLMLMYIRGGSHVVAGLFLGIMYFDMGDDAMSVYRNASALFFTIILVFYASMMPTVLTYPLEVPVLLREILNKWYSLKAYYVAKTLADVPFAVLCTFIYLLICYYMTSQPLDAHRFFRYLAISTYIALVGQTLGLMIGTLFDIQAAVFLGPVFTAPFLLFSGFFLSVKAMPKYIRWLSYVSFLKYYFEGTMFCIYGYNRPDLQCNQPYCHFKNPDKFLREMDLEENVYWEDFWVLVAYNIVLRFAAYFVLRWKLHHSR